MSFGDMGTMFSRAKQMATEAVSDGPRTEYSPELVKLIIELERSRDYTKKFVDTQEQLIQPNPALRAESFLHETFDLKKPEKMTNTELLGSTLESAAQDIDGTSSAYTMGMKKVGVAEKELGTAERRFGKHVHDNCIAPMRKFLAEEFAEAFKEKNALDNLRLDLDAAKNRVAKSKGLVEKEKAEKALQDKQKDFDRQHEFSKVIISRTLNNHHSNHTHQMKEIHRLQSEYFKECSLVMRELDDELKKLEF